ncbi:hypothetical protein [Roseisolibacter agri]|uniref:Lipoprotein n=1 Tax=Roseisolibacter agri TaxID=2014610 RepID=A0AA37QKG4_9BACT|nr:hypothetical protein [Roseisolibacter agri]GLC28563.1 hypothetical protein rosag_50760 [Roseisolibacter agri]
MLPIRRPALGAALLLLAACDATPTAPRRASGTAPSRVTAADNTNDAPSRENETVYDLEGGVVTFYCSDGRTSEPVALSGRIREKTTSIGTPDGTVRFHQLSIPDGLQGVGTVTGQPYRVVERSNIWGHYAERGVIGHQRIVWTLRARDTMETYTLTYTQHYTMDENRDLVMVREWERAACS